MEIPPDIRLRPNSTIPAGPAFLPRLFSGQAFRQDAAAFLLHNARTFGDLVRFTAFGRTILQFNHPTLVHEMLVRDAPHHHRNLVMQRSKAVLGEGLLTSEAPFHLRQRRLAQPAFHRDRIAAYGTVISHLTQLTTDTWTDGAITDVRQSMLLLALRIVGKTLFDTDVEQDIHQISEAVDSFQYFLLLAFIPFSSAVQRLPLPAMRRIRQGRERLDTLIHRMIRERRADLTDRGDLLSMLLAATDPEPGPNGESQTMSDRQVRDECLTILLAGHETTANALSFALALLAHHPEIQDQLAAESIRVLQGRLPTAADYPNLPLAEQVFAEALRLYPPVWVTARTAAEPYDYRGFPIPRGAMLLAPQFAAHRDPRFWPDPLAFDPARFTPANKATRPRFAYYPFGAGTRQCIGEGLAWMEGTLILAAVAQAWRLAPAPNTPAEIPYTPSVSLRPKGPVPLRVHRRP